MPGPFTENPFAGRFGLFQTALNDPQVRSQPGGVQMYVWQGLQNDYLSRGEALPAGAFQAVNQMLSLAGQHRRAASLLSSALAGSEQTGFDRSILAEMSAPSLDSRAINDMPLGPQFRAVYLTQDIVEGEPVLSYKTHDLGYNLPQSVSALTATVEEAAQITAADYGFEWGGVATPVAIHSY
jgi:hypothetical protein